MLIENMNLDEYNITEEFIEPKKATLFSYLLTLGITIIYTVIYLLRYHYANIFATFINPAFASLQQPDIDASTPFIFGFLLEFSILMIFAFLFMATGLLVKAAILASFCDNKWNGLKFRIVREIEKPYCLTVEPVKVKQYIISILAYILITAVIPYIIAFFVGDFMFVLASFISVIWVSSDILLLFRLLRKNGGDYMMDFDCILLYRIYTKK